MASPSVNAEAKTEQPTIDDGPSAIKEELRSREIDATYALFKASPVS